MKYDIINIEIDKDKKNINLGSQLMEAENQSYIMLFKKHKDQFSWTYEDLKMYNMEIIQHVIPLRK